MAKYEHVGLVFRSGERTAVVYRMETLRWKAAYLDGEPIDSAGTIHELVRILLTKDPGLAEVLADRVLLRTLTHEMD